MSSFGTSSTANLGATLAKAATNEHPRVATLLELTPQSIDIASNIKEMLYTKAETLRIDNTPTLMICQRELRVLGEVVPHILNGNTPVSRTAVDLREDFS
jgi:hypothetical protein